MNGDRHRPPPPPIMIIMMIALTVMLNTLRPILIPPTTLNASCPKLEMMMTEAESHAKQVAIMSFWLFSNSAFAFALVGALLQIWSYAAQASVDVMNWTQRGDRVSFALVMVALFCMWISSKFAMFVNLWPSWFIFASSLIEGLLLLLYLCPSL